MKHLAGDVARARASEVGHRVGHFTGRAAAAEQRLVRGMVCRLRRRARGLAHGVDQTRCDAVDGDAVTRQVMRQRPCHADQARLGGDHVHTVRGTGVRGQPTDVDDGRSWRSPEPGGGRPCY